MKEIKALVDKIRVIHESIHIRRPYVIVILEANLDEEMYVGVGIAKVCWPDRWSDKKGLVIARGRAKVDIARQADAEEMVARIRDAPMEIYRFRPLYDLGNEHYLRVGAKAMTETDRVSRPLCDLDSEHNLGV